MEMSFSPQGRTPLGRALQLLTAHTDGQGARTEISTGPSGPGAGAERWHLPDLAQPLRHRVGPEGPALPSPPDQPEWEPRPVRRHGEARHSGEVQRLLARLSHLGRALSRLQTVDGQGPRFVIAGGFSPGGGLMVSILANRVDGLYTDYQAGLPPGLPFADAALADAVGIRAEAVRSVDTAGGNDAVAIEARLVDHIHTGNDSDAVVIQAGLVRDVQTDLNSDMAAAAGVPTELPHAGDDLVAITARLVTGVSTGGGKDAIAVQADLVLGVDAGAGNDAISIAAGMVAGILGGDGNDTISVTALRGRDGRADPPERRSLAEMGVRARFVEVSAAGLQVEGGAGSDAISLRVTEGMGVSGGTGDDLIVVTGGTVAIGYAAGDGHDRVLLSAGAEAVVQLAPGVTNYSVAIEPDALVVTIGEGSIRFEFLGQAGAIGIRTWQGDVTLLHEVPETALDCLV